jgi:hypothetical protein
MANWCYNRVVFTGNKKAIRQIQKLFKAMAAKENEENCGQLPGFVKHLQQGYFFEICCYEEDNAAFSYQTKWSPNIEVLEWIAKRFQVDFTLDYEEPGCLIYGRATCTNGVITDTYLEDMEFDTYDYDEENSTWLFEGEHYESDHEILQTLLERKIAKQH